MPEPTQALHNKQLPFATTQGMLEDWSHIMSAQTKNKEIQVQKPAQSLQAFQQKLQVGQDDAGTLLKPLLIGTGAIAAIVMAFFGVRAYQQGRVEKHEAALGKLVQYVQGSDFKPLGVGEQEKRMKEKLPELEKLAQNAPSSSHQVTAGILNSWKLKAEGKSIQLKADDGPWDRLRQAQRQLALNKTDEAASTLSPLHKKAEVSEAWAPLYWSTLMDLHRLKGDRDKAWQDYAEYKRRFKTQADESMNQVMAGI